jgi:hypothetical protein
VPAELAANGPDDVALLRVDGIEDGVSELRDHGSASEESKVAAIGAARVIALGLGTGGEGLHALTGSVMARSSAAVASAFTGRPRARSAGAGLALAAGLARRRLALGAGLARRGLAPAAGLALAAGAAWRPALRGWAKRVGLAAGEAGGRYWAGPGLARMVPHRPPRRPGIAGDDLGQPTWSYSAARASAVTFSSSFSAVA